MNARPGAVVLAALVGFLWSLTFSYAAPAGDRDPLAVVAEMERLAAQPLWPGFVPQDYPIAIYTGERTLMFGHPNPPEEFSRGESETGPWEYAGRHPKMRSNSNADIGGVTTATLLMTIQPDRPIAEEASILIHETFHLFQDDHFPHWTANEAHKFTYPVTRADNYMATILEDRALARALKADDPVVAARWAATAMAIRRERVEALADEHREFESGLEMMEGTAFYVAHLALGESRSTETLLRTLPPDRFRWRPYATGSALAALLDRFEPGWKEQLHRTPDRTLAELLGAYLSRESVAPIEFPAAELAEVREQAESAVAELAARHARHRERFASPAGWKVTVRLAEGAEPFTLRGFDPVNILALDDGQVLHGHKITLESPAGTVEMLNPGFKRRQFVGLNALSTAPDGHPLFGGIREITFVGFEDSPQVETTDDTTTLNVEGLSVQATGASVRRRTSGILVVLGGDPSP